MMLPLAACGHSGNSGVREIVKRDLPAPPAYLQPVAVADPKAGEPILGVAARERAGRLKANSIIVGTRSAWAKMRKTYQRSR
jgi:hypothetical protein